MSTAYSGIGTPELALSILGKAMGFECCSLSAYELRPSLRAELLRMARANQSASLPCIFGDILESVSSKEDRRDCGLDRFKGGLTIKELYERDLHKIAVHTDKLKCLSHPRCACRLRRACMHVGGSTCTDHSTYGACKGDEGQQAKVFLLLLLFI